MIKTIDHNSHNQWSAVKADELPSVAAAVSSARRAGYSVPNYGGASVQERTREQAMKEALSSVSESRRQQIEDQVISERYGNDLAKNAMRPDLSLGAPGITKKASVMGFGASGTPGIMGGTGNTSQMGPNFYSPLFLTANIMLPKDRPTMNAWNRAFYELNPIVRNCINLHATYPISKFNLKCKDKTIEKKYIEMAENVNLFKVLQEISLEYWMIGEAYPYAEYDTERNMWKRIYLHNPDYMVMTSSPIPGEYIFALKPDEKIQALVRSNSPEHAYFRNQMDPALVKAIENNEYLPLDNFNISHLKNEGTVFQSHSGSLINCVWKDLVLYDLFRENKFIQADAMVNPMTIVKIGASNAEGHYPRQEELLAYRDLFEQAQYDKDYKVFTHPDVNVERVGYSGGVLDINADLQFIVDNIFIGLQVPKSIIMGEGGSYAQASVSLEVIRQRYQNFRGKISNWLKNKIFAPMAEANGFYEVVAGVKHLVLPDVEWNTMTLYDNNDYISKLIGFAMKKI